MSFLLRLDKYNVVLLATVLISLVIHTLYPKSNKSKRWNTGSDRPHSAIEALQISEEQLVNEELVSNANQADEDDTNLAATDNRIEKHDNSYTILLEYGDTFSKIIREIGFSMSNAHMLSTSINKVHNLSKLKSGDQIYISFQYQSPDDGKKNLAFEVPEKITIDFRDARILVEYNPYTKNFESKLSPMNLTTNIARFSGQINNNFISAAIENGAPKAIAMDFVNIFSHAVDFQRDLSAGNKFEILYESKTDNNGKKVRDGKIIYSSLEVKGRKIELYLYEDKDGSSGYFHRDGSNFKNLLLKTPVKASRISSHYGMRKHPILGYSIMHKGLDYAAPRGAPVAAAGDGIVESVRYHKGYGRYVKIKHNAKYATVYAHLDKFAQKLSIGKKVSQGDIIGYVGSTGISTGPHLHYEVHINGMQVNPAKINKITNAVKLRGNSLVAFKNSQNRVESLLSDTTLISMSNNIIKNSNTYEK